MVHMSDQKPGDEIDLLDLFLKTILVLKSNFLLIVAFFTIGLLLGLTHFLTSKKIYENKMIISSSILTISYSKVLFDNLNRHLGEGNVSQVASKLNISEAAAGKIRSIKIENLTKVAGEELTETDRFLITVEIYDHQILPDLQKGLTNYLEDNNFVKVRVEQNRNYLKQMISSVTNEITDLQEFKDGISTGEFFQRAKGNVMFDPTTVNSKIVDLTEKKITLENSLQLSSSVQLVEGFAKFEEESKPRISTSLTGGAIIGLLFIAGVMAVKGIRKLLTIAETSNKA